MKLGTSLKNNLGFDPLSCEIIFRVHAAQRMFQRVIKQDEVLSVLQEGIIIEDYPDDSPFPSVLINGKTISGRPLHIVVAIDTSESRLYIITAYDPDSQKWIDAFSKRTSL
jgi:hypothetical protein